MYSCTPVHLRFLQAFWTCLPILTHRNMGVGLCVYRAAIGVFDQLCKCKLEHLLSCIRNFFTLRCYVKNMCYWYVVCGLAPLVGVLCNIQLYKLLLTLLLISGNIHPNPGPPPAVQSTAVKNLSICHVNARSMIAHNPAICVGYHKIDEIQSVLCDRFKYDIICISETWLDANIPDSSVNIDNYVFVHRPRNRHGGGVGMYIHHGLSCKRRFDLEQADCEMLWLELYTKTNEKILLSVCYRPPNQTANEINAFLESFQASLDAM